MNSFKNELSLMYSKKILDSPAHNNIGHLVCELKCH